MKIIKSGNFPKEAKGVCPLCGCEFIAGKDDINCRLSTHPATGKPFIVDAWLPCPECGCNADLDMSEFKKIGG